MDYLIAISISAFLNVCLIIFAAYLYACYRKIKAEREMAIKFWQWRTEEAAAEKQKQNAEPDKKADTPTRPEASAEAIHKMPKEEGKGERTAPSVTTTESKLLPLDSKPTKENGEVAKEGKEGKEQDKGDKELVKEKKELAQEDIDRFRELLTKVCEDTKLYTKEDMTREELIRAMKTNRTYFSMYLKAATGLSFYEYINKLRIDYAMELPKNPNVALDDIPLTCGYKHKSTYYRAFEARFGCKPNEMRIKLQEKE